MSDPAATISTGVAPAGAGGRSREGGSMVRAVSASAPARSPLPGPLTFEIRCLTSRQSSRGGRHAVTVHGDGTWETPHDLAAERVAAAFGGYCSCVEIADVPLPVRGEVAGLLTRRVRPGLRRRPDGRWILAGSRSCGCATGFASAAAAAQHARSPRHLAACHGVPERLVRLLVDGIGAVLPTPDELLGDGVLAARIREEGGPMRLWAAGLHPEDVARWVALADVADGPLPMSYFLGLAYGGPSEEFLAATLPARPDADTAAWLAWLPAGLDRPGECRALLGLGLPRPDVLTLLACGETADRLSVMALECGVEPVAVGRLVAAWSRVGCTLGADLVRVLVEQGLAAHRPSAAALDALELAASVHPDPPDRAELAVMAALLGGRGAVLHALDGGVRTAAAVVGWMEER